MHWFHRHCTRTHTRQSDTNSNPNAGDHSDYHVESYACDIHQHDEPYTYQYIDTVTYFNSVGHIYTLPACYIDSICNVDAVINAFSDSVHDAQLYIDTLVHCRSSITHTFHHILPITNINITIT